MLATAQPASKMTGGPGNVPTDLSKTAHGPFRTPKSSPRRLPGASPSTLRAAPGPPEELPGAAKPRICKRLQREHHFRPPSQSTWYRLRHPAPPVVRLALRPSTLGFSRLAPSIKPPPRRTRGVGGFYWAAPTAANPESGVPTIIPCEVLKAHGSTVRRTLTC